MTTTKQDTRLATMAQRIPAKTTPENLSEWIHAEIKRGCSRFVLHERSAGPAIPIETYTAERGSEAHEMAANMFRRATEEHQACPLVGSNAFQVRSYINEGVVHGSTTFRVMAAVEGGDGPIEGPGALAVIQQTMRHLEERESNQQVLTIEAVSSIHMAQVDTMATWKELLIAQREGFRAAISEMEKALTQSREECSRLRSENARHLDRALEMAVLHEDLLSAKHERELEASKAKRKEDRMDKAFQSIVIEKVLPAFAVRFGMGKMLGAPAGANGNGHTNGAATNGKSASRAVVLSPQQIHAIAGFLHHVNDHPEDLIAMRAAVSPGTQEKLDALVLAFQGTEETNGAAEVAS